MAINWNLAGYVSPNIEITPEQLPLEALVKTSDVLQDRYDKSKENYTKAQEYQRQMLSQANEADKEAAQQIFSQYENQLKDVADRGDYHNMRWETLNLAQEAANNYASINEKNKAIQAQREAIAKDPRWQTSREQRLKDFELGLKSIQFDPTKRIITNLNVDPYTAAPDVHIMEKSIKYGSVMKPEDIGWKRGYLQYVDFDGKPVSNPMEAAFVNHIVDGKTTETLPADRIKKAVTEALLQDEDVKAVKKRDLKYLERSGEIKFTGDPVKDKAIEDAYDLEHIIKPATAAGQLLKVNNRMDIDDVTQSQGAAFGSGSGKRTLMGVPVNTLADSYGPEGKSLRETLVDGLNGEKGNFNILTGYFNRAASDEKDPKRKAELQSYSQTIKELNKLPQNVKDEVSKKFQLFSGPRLIEVLSKMSETGRDGEFIYSPEAQKTIKKLSEFVTKPFALSNDTELKYKEYSKNNSGFQNINLLVPHYRDNTTNNELQTWIDNSLATNDFSTVKGKLDPAHKYALSKVSDRPLGNGTGIVIELKDKETGQTVLVEPKDERMYQILETTFPGIVSANFYKNTNDFTLGESRSVNDILVENNLPAEKVPANLRNNKIKYSEDKGRGMYYLTDPKGKVLKSATSYIDLLP